MVMLLGYFWNLLEVFLFRDLKSNHEVKVKEMKEGHPCRLIKVTVSDNRWPDKLWLWVKVPQEHLGSQILFFFQLWTHRQNPSHFPYGIWWHHLKTAPFKKSLACQLACKCPPTQSSSMYWPSKWFVESWVSSQNQRLSLCPDCFSYSCCAHKASSILGFRSRVRRRSFIFKWQLVFASTYKGIYETCGLEEPRAFKPGKD